MMTERLYYRDATLLEFDAMAVAHHNNDPRQVVLDRTAFYPTSGGQPHDTGTLNKVAVVDVTDAGDYIVHHLAEPLALGVVQGVITAARRYDHMQQHTAQHLVSALAADRLKWPTSSVHFGAEGSAIEFKTAAASEAQLAQLEAWSNQAVNEALPVSISFEDAEDAIALGLRTAPAREGALRVITIAGLDRSACGGTHVSHTAAIGPIRVLGSERVRGQIRVSFLAGDRTLSHLRAQDELVDTLAKTMSCAPLELAELLPKKISELRDVRERLEALEGEVAAARVAQLFAAALPDADGIRRVVHHGDESAALLRIMAQSVSGLARVVFVGVASSPPGLVIGSSADSGVDAGALLRSVIALVGGKGGGSTRLAQGSLPNEGLLQDVARICAQAP